MKDRWNANDREQSFQLNAAIAALHRSIAPAPALKIVPGRKDGLAEMEAAADEKIRKIKAIKAEATRRNDDWALRINVLCLLISGRSLISATTPCKLATSPICD